MKTKLLIPILLTALIIGCSSSEKKKVDYKPYPQLVPQNVSKIGVRPFVNKTQIFGIEDLLTLELVDEFIRNGSFALVPESQASGVVVGQIVRYMLIPIQNDTNLVPTVYKIEMWLNVKLLDKGSDIFVWEEPALNASHTYIAATLPGGITEERAREILFEKLSKDIVKRTIEGFGTVTSQRKREFQENDKEPTIIEPL
ncbi:MAG: hypothetical protein HN833_02145 [Elusimicrobiaceae bacterium]|jgi:hypothetical protein|nr:hypothetical protein [Elusimicrobiaceae bacterium]MBT3955006.1 hypothetical protein [Elusimicrobiaceae bacterium]MBT4008102.1 hypothetical protein [Elusimicrobiaceae bacterium]MBT4402702.1 hypothetical protein [Elusimicrobiaceae bacterium]MBT4440014.1 hypothetical protein [Elusimicrobiaceae bacterium]